MLTDQQQRVSPLQEEHYHAINTILQKCADLDCILDLCRQAGLECSKQQKINDQRKMLMSGVKATFFPDRP